MPRTDKLPPHYLALRPKFEATFVDTLTPGQLSWSEAEARFRHPTIHAMFNGYCAGYQTHQAEYGERMKTFYEKAKTRCGV